MRATAAGLTVQPVDGAPTPLLTLSGPPGAIRGRLRLGNDGPQRAAVRGFAVRSEAAEVSAGVGSLRARLEPGDRTDVDATLSLDRTTPPGDYQVRLDFDGHEVDALVRVVAEPSLRVTPSLVLASTGSTQAHIEVANVGNVPQDLPEVARSRLIADADVAPPLFGGAAEHGTQTDLDAVLRLSRSLTIPPGASEQLDITIEVPEGLDPERRYVARLPVSTATLRVVVTPAGRTPTPKPRTTATARRSHA